MTAAPPGRQPPPPLQIGPLTLTDLVRYQGASGDMNPLHHDPEVARSAGFAAPVSVGMLQAGLLGTYAASWYGASAVRRLHVRFRRPVLVGASVICHGTIVAERQEHGEQLVDLDLSCTSDGDVVVSGSATLALPTPVPPTPEDHP